MSLRLTRHAEVPGLLVADLPDLAATEHLAGLIAPWLSAGDVVALSGDLGAGKTAFARALLRVLAQEPELEVPSPSFALMIPYDLPRGRVVHADLYRVEEPDELDEVGWDELTDDAILIVEWPENAGPRLPADRLSVELSLAPASMDDPAGDAGSDARRVHLRGLGAFAGRLQRLRAAELLIEAAGFGAAERRYMQGDASSRSYSRLVLPDHSAVLMNAPRRPDGPPVRRGLPYSRLVHLAEDVSAFVGLARGLRDAGFSAPEIYAADLERGLLVTEDFGDAGVVEGTPPAPIKPRYEAAVEVLAALHSQTLPTVLPVAPGIAHVLPVFDVEAFLIEAELMLDWYLPARNVPLDQVVRDEFILLWRNALGPVQSEPHTWILRDYHSPNLIWLPERTGTDRVGLIDFQDAVLGPLMGAQRATKILGIFARLNQRDGKPQYLRHLPRVRRYLARCLGHEELGSLRAWYEAVLPSRDFST
ncbi:MAG: tRNA (adenosine(37)-N6)-threonylcarbamoyltransferase complex ATPase subunit type 1 TsaE [Rhizobiales bacterium 32-66-8]|nr:MAG: tRNA (adenosine(37)-N6)-threonylcarbamoyltransferase complex ATPase subunit type 1 TsaE [Rhizobiales bacterium 32-66-8]